MEKINQKRLQCGVTVLGEQMPGAASLAMSMLVPAGLGSQPENKLGVAPMLSEMMCRGAGELDAREFSDALDMLGVDRSTQVDTQHLKVSATMIGEKVTEALPLLVSMVTKPHLDEEGLEPTRLLGLQAIEGLKDEPQQQVMYELREKHHRKPFGRSPLGEAEAIKGMTRADVYDFWKARCRPGGSILALSGLFDWEQVCDQLEGLFEGWKGDAEAVKPGEEGARGQTHLGAETSQTHIALAYDAVPENDARSILQKAAVSVLSGGMSGRLFTEVREKRGLCYSVYASYGSQRDRGMMFAYAGTTTARAQETLDVLVAELRRVHEGVSEDEFRRAIVGMKSRLVMQGESTSARASAIASEQYICGSAKTLDQWAAEVDGVTLEGLNGFLKDNMPGEMTLVTIGEEKLVGAGS
ncbi:M16 family metallopeptidase [Poriferisphaera sp. WC338]|uniref:M16 family metallopeptidase n=1 Tax=Poriferisphaera sp. WC338 TaxID=3425129 RepID=UPI003D81633E